MKFGEMKDKTDEDVLEEAAKHVHLREIGMGGFYIVEYINPDTGRLQDVTLRGLGKAEECRNFMVAGFALYLLGIAGTELPQDALPRLAADHLKDIREKLAAEASRG